MDHHRISQQVERVFAGRTTRSTRVALEQELFVVDLVTGGHVHPDRVRAAIPGRCLAHVLSFEPGGQVELSLRPRATPSALAGALLADVRALSSYLAPDGLALVAAPVSCAEPPRVLHSPRYDAMERHLDSIGPAGRRMMRSTASTQVCLDWWPGCEGLEQWEVLNLAGPFLAAAVCDGPDGRLATWLAVDPGRTAFDDRLLHGDPVAAYVDLALHATAFVGDDEHVSTLFPPVRPRLGYLEVRFPDARPAVRVEPLVHGLASLLYDGTRRRAALDSLRGERHRLGERWEDAAAGRLDPTRGLELLGLRPTAVAA